LPGRKEKLSGSSAGKLFASSFFAAGRRGGAGADAGRHIGKKNAPVSVKERRGVGMMSLESRAVKPCSRKVRSFSNTATASWIKGDETN
jgi:hypothetical protein